MGSQYGLNELYTPPKDTGVTAQYVYFIWNDVVGALAVWAVVCLGSWKAARATDVQLLPALVLHVCRTLTGICQYRVRAWSLWSFSKDVDSQKPRP